MERGREGFGILFFWRSYFLAFERANRTDRFVNSRLLNNTHWDRLQCDGLFALVVVCVRKACA